jgi:lysophospholipase L1-like esterase
VNDAGRSAPISITRLSAQKKLLFATVTTLFLFSALETTIRVGAYFLYGRSPYFLFYGFRDQSADDQPEGHNVAFRGYSKFQPNREIHQYGMFTRPTPIRINAVGLRGPDFAMPKPPNVVRVICLGESSTFGFFDRDEFTYPALTAARAHKAAGRDGSFETINAGIPHANSDNMLAMMKGELLEYQPNVFTLYAGFNDAVLMMDENTTQSILRWLHGHIATYVVIKRAVAAMGGPLMYSRWSGYLTDVDEASVDRQIALHVSRYERNVRQMVALARQDRAKFVFIRQPITMDFDDPNSNWRQYSYAQRVNVAAHALVANHKVSDKQTVLLVHSELMKTLDRLARELSVPIVDNIAIVDAHPEYFASYVHLTEDGNRALAAALTPVIVSQ